MTFDPRSIPPALFGTWKQLSGKYTDVETGEERPGLSRSPNGFVHFSRNGRMFNITVDSARKEAAGKVPTAAEAEALYRSMIAYTGVFSVKGDKIFFDVDVSWNQGWSGTRQERSWRLEGDRLHISARIINPMTGKPAVHRLEFERVADH